MQGAKQDNGGVGECKGWGPYCFLYGGALDTGRDPGEARASAMQRSACGASLAEGRVSAEAWRPVCPGSSRNSRKSVLRGTDWERGSFADDEVEHGGQMRWVLARPWV